MKTPTYTAMRRKRAKRWQGKLAQESFKDFPCPTPAKISHLNKTLAKRAKRRMRHEAGKRYVVYRCSCGSWHVGTHIFETRHQHRLASDSKLRA